MTAPQKHERGEHRTTGGRAWCYDCSEWCYTAPEMQCKCCRVVALEAEVAALQWEVRMSGRFQLEYEWAQAHPDVPAAKTLLLLAQLYVRHPDAPTLGLIEGAVDEVRKAIAT